jgi:hypothetical protein
MENGRITESSPTLSQLRNAFARNFSCLDNVYKSLDETNKYPVTISRQLIEIQKLT